MRSIVVSSPHLFSHTHFDGHEHEHKLHQRLPPRATREKSSWKIYIFMSENNCRLTTLIVSTRNGDWRVERKSPARNHSKTLGIFTIERYLSKLRTHWMIDMRSLNALESNASAGSLSAKKNSFRQSWTGRKQNVSPHFLKKSSQPWKCRLVIVKMLLRWELFLQMLPFLSVAVCFIQRDDKKKKKRRRKKLSNEWGVRCVYK